MRVLIYLKVGVTLFKDKLVVNYNGVDGRSCTKSSKVIMEYLVKTSKKARILELKRRHLKITVLTSYTAYPLRKIRRICACTSLKSTKEQGSIRRLRKKYRLSFKNDMPPREKMDNPNITMEEYIRLKEEKAHRHGKVYNWETATYDSENYKEKVNMPSFPSHTVSYFNDLDFLKDFECEFPAIVYNDALTSKSDSSTELVEIHHHIDEFDLKTETSLSKCDEEEQNILYFNDLFPFNIIYPHDLESDKDNDDNEIDIIQSSGGNINTQGSKKFLEASHDKINKIFIMESFVMELDVNILAWNYLNNRMLLNLIKNLYVPFGIPFDPKLYYKDGVYTRMLRRPRYVSFTLFELEKLVSKNRYDISIRQMALPPRDQRHQYLRFKGLQYTNADIVDSEMMLGKIYRIKERECKLYDEFDKFAYKKGETLCEFYLRFSLLLNDMNIYNMKLEQFQVNTKFLNTLPLEWSKFVTDVKLVRDLHTTNIDQLHAYLGQHEFHANEKGDDLIDAINHMMSLLTAVVTSCYPTTNNQVRNSSNPRQQATINNGRVTLQPIQGRQTSLAAGTTRTYTPGSSRSNSRKQRTVICYNCKGEGHMSK
ncbi:hypothetical protein Tco_0637585 [Tanacetum coccineum]